MFWQDANKDGTTDHLFRINNGEIKGVLGVSVDKNNMGKMLEVIDYWVGTEHVGDTPESLHELNIPASRWAVFEVRGSMPDAMQSMLKKTLTEWFPSNAYEHAGTPELEVYPGGDSSSPDYYSELWIPVK